MRNRKAKANQQSTNDGHSLSPHTCSCKKKNQKRKTNNQHKLNHKFYNLNYKFINIYIFTIYIYIKYLFRLAKSLDLLQMVSLTFFCLSLSLTAFVVIVRGECSGLSLEECLSSTCCPKGGGASCMWMSGGDPPVRRRQGPSVEPDNPFESHSNSKRQQNSCTCPMHTCCPVDCVLSQWSTWSECSTTCGPGSRERTRALTPATCGGTCLDTETFESELCGSCCATNCALSQWSSWSACSTTCGLGASTRVRSLTPAICGGLACDPTEQLMETIQCIEQCCVEHCQWSPWSQWSTCSATCGPSGELTRTRYISSQSSCGGAQCSGNAVETMPCGAWTPCADNCQVGVWSAWSTCDATCGNATRQRSRPLISPATGGGTACPPLSEQTSCALPCCPTSCVWNNWGAWSSCSLTCGSGVRSRTRTIAQEATCGGAGCSSEEQLQSSACSNGDCPVNCVVGIWTAWSACSQTCGTGLRSRSRAVLTPPVNGGLSCPSLNDSTGCTQPNACICGVTSWSTWSACNQTCGGGTRSRDRMIVATARDCPPTSESDTCNSQPCVFDCQVSDWSTWSLCNATCGTGSRMRLRTVVRPAAGGGLSCPQVVDSEPCATGFGPCVTEPTCNDFVTCDECLSEMHKQMSCQFCVPTVSAAKGLCQASLVEGGGVAGALLSCPTGFVAVSTCTKSEQDELTALTGVTFTLPIIRGETTTLSQSGSSHRPHGDASGGANAVNETANQLASGAVGAMTSLDWGVIGGAIGGGALALILIGLLAVFLVRRWRQSRRRPSPSDNQPGDHEMSSASAPRNQYQSGADLVAPGVYECGNVSITPDASPVGTHYSSGAALRT
jgi:hypothetical protein